MGALRKLVRGRAWKRRAADEEPEPRADSPDGACDGACPAGFYCPSGTPTTAIPPCGGPAYYCPAGVSASIVVVAGCAGLCV